ncbi:MAG: xanthine dehydrogenase family protein molybdopterin-binding subunit [Acidimicrobiales bacterium]|nr:xanthine dehydrogenase family protein molybdopterin-binding subunit [Acidimicrobiales bacterium]
MGRTVRRKEDARLVTGRGRFVSDLNLAGMKHVAFLRSTYGHARITSISIEEAESAPYVQGVFTGEHPAFAGVALRARSGLETYVETAQPILAQDKVRFAGEAVAAVVADDRYLAEDAAELVVVDYDPLPTTVSAWAAQDAPWPGHMTPVHAEAPDNVLLRRTFQAGDVEAGLVAATVVVEQELFTNRHAANPIECRAGVAWWDGDRLTFWSGTQVPHLLRNCIADLLGLREGSVRVVAPDVGGGFGVKAVVYPEDVALCLIALRLPGIPVKWVEDRVEHLQAATHAREHRYRLRAGFSDGGQLLALDADVTCNVGAYSVYPWTAGIEPLMAGGLLSGPYRLGNYRCSVRGVVSNTTPSGPYRGVARPATVFAMESVLDEAARLLGISSVEIRRRNLIGPDDIPYRMPSGLVDDSGWYGECLERVLEQIAPSEVKAEQERRRTSGENPIGLGIACYNELTGLGRAASAGPRMPFRTGHEACTVRVNPDGCVTVLSGVCSQGQALETTMAQVVSDALGVDYDDVDVRIGDTAESLWGFGAFSSRQGIIGGGAAHEAAIVVRQKVIDLAAELFEANPDDLRVEAGEVRVAGQETPLCRLEEVARVAYLESHRLPESFEPGLEATRFYDPIRGAFAAGAQAAVIEIDRATGEIDILKWACVEDTGTVINPGVVQGQVAGAIAQGIGGSLLEKLEYDDAGNLITGTLMDYLMPSSADVPDISIGHVSHPANNPLGVRGVGEGGTLGPYAVLAGAVGDALGVRIDHLPLTPNDIWSVLK